MNRTTTDNNNMISEYDFSNGVRGKHAKLYKKGHSVNIHKKDSSIEEHYFTLQDGAVMLDEDVRKVYHDSESVNNS